MLRLTCPLMQHGKSFQDGCAIGSRDHFYLVAEGARFLSKSTHMTFGFDCHWDIAQQLRKHVSQVAVLCNEVVSSGQASAPEEQRLCFDGWQLEDGSSPACLMKTDRGCASLVDACLHDSQFCSSSTRTCMQVCFLRLALGTVRTRTSRSLEILGGHCMHLYHSFEVQFSCSRSCHSQFRA